MFVKEKTTPPPGIIRLIILFLILLGVAALVYGESLSALAAAVLHRKDSSHGLFVPIISAYFLWIKRDRFKRLTPEPSILSGVIILICSLLLLGLSKISGFQVAILSFLFFTGALVLFFFGRSFFIESAFPLFFLVTMIPLPSGVYFQIAEWMRSINTWGSLAITKAFGAPVYREGYDVFLPGLHLVVEDACSGIRYLLSFFTFSIVYAVLFKKSLLARIFLVLASIPLSIIAGITRLSVVFLAAYYINPFWAEHRPHVFLSWVVFGIFVMGAIAVDQHAMRLRENKCAA